jgi:UDP-N-acetylmuramoyl-L-alanyl-D-glutamate--2,6-diaminopimelate ligase
MKLSKLVKGLNVTIKGSKDVEVLALSNDSRKTQPGSLFFAKKGHNVDGANFIPQALKAGAVAIVTDLYDPFIKCTQIITKDVVALEPIIASRFFSDPSKELFCVGITGTKGKTTTSYLVKHLLDHLGISSGLIGTNEIIISDKKVPSNATTIDVISNHKFLKEMLSRGQKGAVMEVSSHGLDQNRVDEIDFSCAIFTNLYPDHLDYHKNFEEYFLAKQKLLKKSRCHILNADTVWDRFDGIKYGIEKGDIQAKNIEFTDRDTHFLVDGVSFSSKLIGKHNVYNMLAAISLGVHLGKGLKEISAILQTFESVSGRLERFGNVFVDFAHTGEALENVLLTLRQVCSGKIITVFGCGGNRDPQRRFNMAKSCEKYSDISIVTTDNPRTEDPKKIIQEILDGFETAPIVIEDRKEAIFKAIELAKEKDFVLIAGKGHEKVQIFGHQTFAFDDLEVAKDALQKQSISVIV